MEQAYQHQDFSNDYLVSVVTKSSLHILNLDNYAFRKISAKVSKWSSPIKHFWKIQDERQNIVMRNKLIEDKTNLQEEKARMKVQELQTAQHMTIAMVATEQIQEYATSTTTSIAERFLDNSNKGTSKCIRTYKDSNDDDVNEDNFFWLLIVENVQNEENEAKILFHSPRNYNEIVQYLDAMRKLLKYDQVVVQRPPVWTESLNTYIDNVLKSEIMQKIDGDEYNMFRLYSTIWSIDIFPNFSRKIGERKYIVQNISSLFKFYEVTFGNMCFDWIESHSPASKLTKTLTNSGIVKVDIRVGTSENRQAQNAKVVVRQITGYLSDKELKYE
ncbi:7921_t:CDS:10 [Entrophospora sp. SA101]|nr:7921_t:CDS:10 [Entrophospora sp. SA101]